MTQVPRTEVLALPQVSSAALLHECVVGLPALMVVSPLASHVHPIPFHLVSDTPS